jgi:archaellum component FlaC
VGEKCGEVYDSSDEYNRDERIETYYQGWGAREMAERIVNLEDELGADVDGICTGMHADVAEARAEVERLRTQVESFRGWRASIYEVARS